MKWIDDWIIKKAKRLKDEKEEEKKRELALLRAESEKFTNHKKKLREILIDFICIKADLLEKTECHISVGDNCILNRYELKRNHSNGWDGGVSSLLVNGIPEKEIISPVIVKVTEITTSNTLAIEKVDKFLYKFYDSELFKFSESSITTRYESYLISERFKRMKYVPKPRYDKSPFDLYGNYKVAKFESKYSFKPKWGLNINCFIKAEDSDEYKDTFTLWQKEINLNIERTIQKDREKRFEEDKKNIFSKYG